MRLREASVYVWLEEPICTVFSVPDPSAREDNCLSILETLIEHHPRVAKLHFVGVHDSEILGSRLSEYHFIPFELRNGRVAFVRPIDSISNVACLAAPCQSKLKTIHSDFRSPSYGRGLFGLEVVKPFFSSLDAAKMEY